MYEYLRLDHAWCMKKKNWKEEMKTKSYKSDHASEILSSLNRERNSEDNFCDITIQGGTRDFPAHRCVLASFSSFFKKLFTIEMKEKYEEKVKLQHVDKETLDSILNFIYTCQVSISSENVYKVLEASNFMDITRLKEICGEFLCEEIDKTNCFSILKYAKLFNMEKLRDKAQSILSDDFESVIKGEEFRELEIYEVLGMMEHKEKKVSSEESVFNALMNWINHDVTTREKHLVDLFNLLELERLTGHFLANVIGNEDLILNSPSCTKKMIKSMASCLNVGGQSVKDVSRGAQQLHTMTGFYKTLGMSDYKVADHQITASSSKSNFNSPQQSRLHGKSAWMPKHFPGVHEWLQVDLLQATRVTGVITQGEGVGKMRWVTRFKISYGMLPQELDHLFEDGIEKIFQGNQDGCNLVINMFPAPINARYIRFVTMGSPANFLPALRLDYLTS